MTRRLSASFDQVQDTFILDNTASRQYFWRMIQLFHLSTGWTTIIESDGLTRNTGDQITGDNTGADGVNNGAYTVQRSGDGREICWQIVVGTATNDGTAFSFTYAASAADGFTGGTATVRPTATDEGVILTAQNYEAVTNTALGSTQHICLGAVESVAPYRFFAMILEDTANGSCRGAFGRDEVATSTQFPSLDDHPDHAVYWHSNGNSMDITGFIAKSYYDTGPPATSANFLDHRVSDASIYDGAQSNAHTVTFDGSGLTSFPVMYRRTTAVGAPRLVFGMGSNMLRFKNFNDGAATQWRSMQDDDAGGVFGDSFGCNDFIFPWLGDEAAGASGTFPPWSNNGSPSAARHYAWPEALSIAAAISLGEPVDSTPPQITNLTPAAGSSLDANEPITLDVTDETGFGRVAILASFSDGIGGEIVEVVHDGDAFRGNYLGVINLRTNITDGFRFTILRDGGWTAAPTFEFLAVDAGGNEAVIV